jgi:hypothetical protein
MRFTEKTEFTQFIFEDLAEIVLPAHELVDMANFDVEPPHDTRFKLARLMEKFVTRAGQVIKSPQVRWSCYRINIICSSIST